MTTHHVELNRAQVTVTPPGGTRLTVLGPNSPSDLTAGINKQQLYSIFYEMYRRHPWVRAAIDKRAQTAVQVGFQMTPADPHSKLDEGKAREFRAFARRSNFAQLRRMTYRDVDIYSEAWWWVQRTRGGKPFKAFRLHPKYVVPRISGGVMVGIDYGAPNDNGTEFYPLDELVHFRDEDPEQDIQGLSKLYSLMETVSIDLFAMRYNRSFFENSAQTGIVFNMRNATKEEAERNRVWLEQNYAGAERAHRPIVLEGDIQVQRSVANSQEMEYIQGRRVNRQEILAVLDVNETLLGITDNANRSSSKENDVTFRDSIAARQLLVEEEINNKLILGMFGWDDLLFEENDSSKRGQLEQTSLLNQLLQQGVINRDEWRAKIGLGNIDGGDLYTVQTATGLVPVSKLLELYEKNLLAPQHESPVAPEKGDDEDGNDEQKREDRRGEADARER